MNIKEANGHWERHTTALSTVLRQSAFAGIALAWAFRAGPGASQHLDGAGAWAAAFYVLGMVLDVTQYAVLSLKWQAFIKTKSAELLAKHDGEDLKPLLAEDFSIPRSVNKSGIWAFWAKTGLFVGGHVALLLQLAGAIVG